MGMSNIREYDEVLHYLSDPWRKELDQVAPEQKAVVSELRFRTGCPVCLTIRGKPWFPDHEGKLRPAPSARARKPTQAEMEELVASLCDYSVHTHAEEIREGYISLANGSRAGLCGQAVMTAGEITGIEKITSLNIRIAREIPDVADPLMEAVLSMQHGMLIYGPPGSGKTTLLKDLIRQLAGGKHGFHTVAAADERGELNLDPQGLVTLDRLLGYPKYQAITHAARTLSPEYVICDEIGTAKEVQAMSYALGTGVKLIATVHAGSPEEFRERRITRELMEAGLFDQFVQLGSAEIPCKVVRLYTNKEA